MKDFKKAVENYEISLRIKKETNDLMGIAYVYNNLGNIYVNQKELDKAMQSYTGALAIEEQIGDQYGMANSFQNIGSLYREKGDFAEAIRFFAKGLELSKKIGVKKIQSNVYEELAVTYERNNDFKNAYQSLRSFALLKDTLFNEERSKQMTEMATKYETTEKEKEIQLQKARLEKSEEESKKQRLFLILFVAIAVGVASIAIVIFRSLKITRKQKEVIEKQKILVDQKNHAIEEKQREIIDSINYSKRLQEAILPPMELIRKHLPESFVFYRPKDIVAGDFYWMEEKDDILFIAAADCTGHGVPGAMVSVVCSNALNRAVKELGIKDTGKILDKVTDFVIETFAKSNSDVQDGMDISLLSFNKATKEIKWSGAYNPLWYCIGSEMRKVRPDKQPVGKYEGRKPFAAHQIEYREGMVFYLFTDGFADQFGGPQGKKYMYKRFEEQLTAISSLPMKEQENVLNKSFCEWKKDSEQIDDVTVIGFRL
ncbi:MAG TPA: tetratricopeptide repeat protein [Bacteroidia bacterium]